MLTFPAPLLILSRRLSLFCQSTDNESDCVLQNNRRSEEWVGMVGQMSQRNRWETPGVISLASDLSRDQDQLRMLWHRMIE